MAMVINMSENVKLAKKIKIRTIFVQRNFIIKMLEKLAKSIEGDCTLNYLGHLYPENIEYFKKEGFDIRFNPNDEHPERYTFTVSDKPELHLFDGEMKEALWYMKKNDEKLEKWLELLRNGLD